MFANALLCVSLSRALQEGGRPIPKRRDLLLGTRHPDAPTRRQSLVKGIVAQATAHDRVACDAVVWVVAELMRMAIARVPWLTERPSRKSF
jgi:hypothetical protein